MSDSHRPEGIAGRLTALPGSLPYILAFAFALDGFWGDGDVLIALDVGRLGPSPEQRHGCYATLQSDASCFANPSDPGLRRIGRVSSGRIELGFKRASLPNRNRRSPRTISTS